MSSDSESYEVQYDELLSSSESQSDSSQSNGGIIDAIAKKYNFDNNITFDATFLNKHCTDKYSKEMAIKTLDTLIQNPELLFSLIESASFYSNNHPIDDCNEHHAAEEDCENCYSGDTEHEKKCELIETLKLLYGQSQFDELNSDGEDED